MMETLLTLPVYMLLLACLFWLGELCLTRSTLNSGENLRLWESGIRYPISQVPERDIFCFLPIIEDADVVTGVEKFRFILAGGGSTNWGRRSVGRAQINTKRSLWSYGINHIVTNFTNSSASDIEAPGAEEQAMISIGTIEKTVNRHILSRADYTSRDGIYERGTNDGNAWKTEYLTNWNLDAAGTIAPVSAGDYKDVSVYGNRDSSYVTWSN